MCRNTINFLYKSGHMVLWCLKLVPGVCARLVRSSTMEISCLKWCNMHAQLTKINMTKSHFNLLQEIKFSTLMAQNHSDRHRILKDNSWMCILHQYHKASMLKACTAMCQKREKNWVNIFHQFKMAAPMFSSWRWGGGWSWCCEQIWNNYVGIH